MPKEDFDERKGFKNNLYFALLFIIGDVVIAIILGCLCLIKAIRW
jgi:hypothetical protein